MSEATEKDITATTEQVGQYKQSAPRLGEGQRLREAATEPAVGPTLVQLPENQLFDKANSVLCWLARFPIQYNHPRKLTGAIRGYVAAGEVLVVNTEERISRVFKKLATEGFLAVPVLDRSNRFLYFFGLQDLLWHVCNTFTTWQTETYGVGTIPQPNQMWSTYFDLKQFAEAKVEDVSALAKMQPRLVSMEGFSTLSAVEAMLNTKSRRIILLTKDGRVRGILTLSMVISSFDQHLEEFGQLRNSTVDHIEANCGYRKPLVTVFEDEPTINALKQMVMHNITSVAVVNRENILVDILSVRDLRGLGTRAEHFERLWRTVGVFKRDMHAEFSRQNPSKPITVSKRDTFSTVVRKMDDGNIHHLYIVEPALNKKDALIPVGVLSQADVISYALYKCGLQMRISA